MATKTDELVPVDQLYSDMHSRFYSRDMLQDGEKTFLATYYPVEYPHNAEDIYHQVTAGDEGRLDLIAYRYYNSAMLWWVIAEANNIFHPIKEVKAGIYLRVPSWEWVFSNVIR